MLIVLLTALSAAPSAAALADAGHLHGYLVTPVQYGGEAQSEVPLSQMTREQLKAEYKRLDDEKPGLGGQITMIAMGGAALGIGAVTLWVSFLIAISGSVPLVPLLVGVGLMLGGGALLTVGIIMLRMARAEREAFTQAQEEIERRLDGSYAPPGEAPPVQPDRYDPVPPPPPPPPPPGAGFPAVRPSLVLATF